MLLTVSTTQNLVIDIQNALTFLQLLTAIALGILAYLAYARDKSKIHMEMYDSIEKLQILYMEKFACKSGSHEEKILNNIKEHLCNRYEILCYEYFKRRISRKSFKDMYFPSIIQHVEDKNYIDFYSPSGIYNCYDYTMRVYYLAKKACS